jgi:hypothetical protein
MCLSLIYIKAEFYWTYNVYRAEMFLVKCVMDVHMFCKKREHFFSDIH